jgi:anti-sigma B factor antagonist
MVTLSIQSNVLDISVNLDSIDASNAGALKSRLKEVSRQGADRVVLNLSEVNFIDSSGIGVLLSFYKQMNQEVVLRKPTPTVLSVLELLRLHRVFEVESE